MINFPCPKSVAAMTSLEGGYHCGSCNKKVTDLTHLSEVELLKWKSENATSCVVINETQQVGERSSLARFALALLMVAGSSLFTFSNAQVTTKIEEVNGQVIKSHNPSIGILQVKLVNQYDRPTWGNVWVQLPNGKELELFELEEGKYYVEIPVYCKGKELVVYAEHLGKIKHVTTSIHQVGEELSVSLKFKSRKEFRAIVVGSF